jgi:molecular chaperone IbpA
VKVATANLNHGLLTIELVREIPEAMKPRRIQIQAEALPNQEPTPQVGQRPQKVPG